jgi:phosphoribosylglycinamide formyltransferase 1
MKRPIAILISGRGSNMRALAEACTGKDYPARVALVLSNVKDAAGLAWAAERGIQTATVEHRAYGGDREAFERALDREISGSGAGFVCLAGFMRVLTPWFIDTYRGRLINIHPSLLPAFPGLHTHRRALEAGVAVHGCTVHHVIAHVDAGEIIQQASVPVLPDDTEDALAARVLVEEWRLYPEALRRVLLSS